MCFQRLLAQLRPRGPGLPSSDLSRRSGYEAGGPVLRGFC